MVNLKQMCHLKESSSPEATWTFYVQTDVWSHKGLVSFNHAGDRSLTSPFICKHLLSTTQLAHQKILGYLFKQTFSLWENVCWIYQQVCSGLFLFSSLWPAFVSLQGIPLTKKTAMLEQLGKCYIYLIGLYMAIGETSLHKIEFPILMREFRAAENVSALSKESNFVITEYLRG